MADNLLKACADAIAESDNEIGGLLITRLREAHRWGQNGASMATASPTTLTSKVDLFDADWVGLLIDVLEKDTPTGNEGSYVVATYVDEKNVTLEHLDGATPAFVDESDVQWRLASLRVETTLEFPRRDRNLQVWVGEEPDQIPYCETVIAPGACVIEGLGGRVGDIDGIIDSASPQTFKVVKEGTFVAGDVGKTIRVLLPDDGVSIGNDGPKRITAVVSDTEVTVVGPAFAADEISAAWFKSTYAGDGYLTADRGQDDEVIDATGNYSALNRLRRSFLVDYSTEEELDRIGRTRAVERPRGLDHEPYRRVIKVLSYMPKTTLKALRDLLTALFPGGGWQIYEDLMNYPCTVFIHLPYMDPGEDTEGRAFLSQQEDLTSDTASQITLGSEPSYMESVLLQDAVQRLGMAALPSADSPVWTYTTEGETEGNTFAVVTGDMLEHTQDRADANGGRYTRALDNIEAEHWDIGAWFKISSKTTVGGKPWQMIVRDGQYEVSLLWDDAGFALGQADGTERETAALALTTDKWYLLRLERRGDVMRASVGPDDLFGPVDVTAFTVSAVRDYSFGYVNNTNNQDWVARWDGVLIGSQGVRNYCNLRRTDGQIIAGSPSTINSASNPFIVEDSARLVRIWSDDNLNHGVWRINSYVGAGQCELRGFTHTGARVEGQTGVGDGAIVTADDHRFSRRDVGKYVKISNSTLGNDGSYPIVEFVTEHIVKVTNGAGFDTESEGLIWEFDADQMANESSLQFEVIDAGSVTGAVLTMRDSLPAATTDVTVRYSVIPSAQALLNESVLNLGESGGEPDLYYPFYLTDADFATRALCDEVTAAGVIPEYGLEKAY